MESAIQPAKSTSSTTCIDKTSAKPNRNEHAGPGKKTPTWLRDIIQIVAEQWFLISLGVLIAIASQVQVPLDQQELKRTVTSYLCISIIFFALVFQYPSFVNEQC